MSAAIDAFRLVPLRAFTADSARIAEPYLGQCTVCESTGSSGKVAGVLSF
jgi:hypothetical protein